MTTRPHRTLLGMFGGVQLLAITADRLKQFAFISMVGILAPGSSTELLKLNLFMQVPMLVFTPLVGAMLDRWNRSDAIVGACIVRAALLLCLPALFGWSGSIYAVYALAACLAVADLVFAPARSALLPELVTSDRLLRVNAAFWAIGVVATLAGFLGGGWLFDYFSWESTFYANSLAYLAAAALMIPVLVMHGRRAEGAPGRVPGGRTARNPVAAVRSVVDAVVDSVRLIRTDQHIGVSLVTQSSLFGMGGVLAIIGVAHVQELAAPDERAVFLGIIGASLVVGMMVGSGLLSLVRGHVSVERTVSVATIVSGVAIAGIGRTDHLIPLSVWAGVLGMAISPVFVVTETLIQRQSPREHLGRVFTAREALIKTAYLAAAALATLINAFVSKTAILVALGLFLALLGVVLERTRWLETPDNEEQERS